MILFSQLLMLDIKIATTHQELPIDIDRLHFTIKMVKNIPKLNPG